MRGALLAFGCVIAVLAASPAQAATLSDKEKKELVERKREEIERRQKTRYCADAKHAKEKVCRDLKNDDSTSDSPPTKKPKVGAPKKPGDDLKRDRERGSTDAPRKGERDPNKDDRSTTRPPRETETPDRERRARPTPPPDERTDDGGGTPAPGGSGCGTCCCNPCGGAGCASPQVMAFAVGGGILGGVGGALLGAGVGASIGWTTAEGVPPEPPTLDDRNGGALLGGVVGGVAGLAIGAVVGVGAGLVLGAVMLE